ncbi:MAG: thiol:disulfide interchange protein [Candidatus Dadabacteria bacterium]|nr:MAG: thiol:disulfide interchange protein [Candidatus Dadabacteria bacterium]
MSEPCTVPDEFMNLLPPRQDTLRHLMVSTRTSFRHALGAALLLLLLSLPGLAGASTVPPSCARGAIGPDQQPHSQVCLISDHDRIAPGQPFRIGIRITLDPGWHTYWRNPGEAALPSHIEWSAPSFVRISDIHWPLPHSFDELDGELRTIGYADEVLLFSEAQLTGPVDGDDVALTANVRLLVCEIQCVPFVADVGLTLPVATEPSPGEYASLFDRYAAQVPAVDVSDRVDISVDAVPPSGRKPFAARLLLRDCPDHACPGLDPSTHPHDVLFHDAIDGLDIRPTAVQRTSDGWLIALRGESRRNFSPDQLTEVAGDLRLTDGSGARFRVPVQFPAEATLASLDLDVSAETEQSASTVAASAPASPHPSTPLWAVLLAALLGGILLNIMPCVFPVLAIKVTAFTELAGQRRRDLLIHGATYTAGIISTLLLLAGAIIALRNAGHAVGWGFQFQEPHFVIALTVVIVAFALNLFGLYQIGIVGGNARTEHLRGLRRSFGEGVLAVVLATPCSAPFLGTAAGFAFTSTPAMIIAIFSLIGLGLALPFVLLTLIPGATKFLPRPGHWLDRFKQFLGFLLLLTAIWLLDVLGLLAGAHAVSLTLVLLLTITALAWIWGAVQYREGRRKWLPVTFALLPVIAAAIPLIHLDTTQAEARTAPAVGRWSPEAVQQALASGRPVFVDVTAAWCITCKVNERAVLNTAPVHQLFAAHRVQVLVADWTHYDASITALLEANGRIGVPMYLLYLPGRDRPVILPELLTQNAIRTALSN